MFLLTTSNLVTSTKLSILPIFSSFPTIFWTSVLFPLFYIIYLNWNFSRVFWGIRWLKIFLGILQTCLKFPPYYTVYIFREIWVAYSNALPELSKLQFWYSASAHWNIYPNSLLCLCPISQARCYENQINIFVQRYFCLTIGAFLEPDDSGFRVLVHYPAHFESLSKLQAR